MCSDEDDDDDGWVKLPGSKTHPHRLPSSRNSGHVCSQRRSWGKQGESQSSPLNCPIFVIVPAAPLQHAQLTEGTSDSSVEGWDPSRVTGVTPVTSHLPRSCLALQHVPLHLRHHSHPARYLAIKGCGSSGKIHYDTLIKGSNGSEFK